MLMLLQIYVISSLSQVASLEGLRGIVVGLKSSFLTEGFKIISGFSLKNLHV